MTEMVKPGSPELRIHVNITSVSLPNLGALESKTSALVSGEARVSVQLPEHLRFDSESGRFLLDRATDSAGSEQQERP